MSENKYKIAQEVYEEWRHTELPTLNGVRLEDWLKEKTKPKNQIFHKLNEFMAFVHGGVSFTTELRCYNKFKEIFKDDLNGTRGLDEAIEGFEKAGLNETRTIYNILNYLKLVKAIRRP